MIVDITPEYLIPIIGVKLTKELMQKFKGCRIYLPKCKSEHDEIKNIFNSMTCEHSQKIKQLSRMYDKSESQIRNIVKKQGVLFEEYR